LLDSLRGVGAVSVVVAHVAITGHTVPPGSALRPYVERLDVVLIVFFALSAFLLYRPFVAARLDGRRPSVLEYGWRRIIRVLPAYRVALTIVTLWLGLGSFWDPLGLLTYFGLLQNYTHSTISGGLPQAWTLVIEAAFYVLLPVWALIMRRLPARGERAVLRSELWGVAVLVALSVAYKLAAAAGGVAGRPEPAMYTLPAQLDFFALGMGLAVVSAWGARAGRLPRPLAAAARHPGLCWGSAALAFLLSTRILTGSYDHGYTPAEYAARHVLYAFTALALMVPGAFAVADGGRVRRVMGFPPLAYLGTLAYGIYLWHLGIMIQLQRWDWGVGTGPGAFLELLLPTLGGALVAGALSWHLLQRPMVGWRLPLLRRRPPDAAAPPVPAVSPIVASRS
jgi:peptidoglycan/LPS O-acetylase OafA/YrhL